MFSNSGKTQREKNMLPFSFFSIFVMIIGITAAAAAGCPTNSHVKPGTEKNARVICNCDAGYENRGGGCRPVPGIYPNTKDEQLRRLRDEAASEWYWFTINHWEVMTGAFWAAYGYEPGAE